MGFQLGNPALPKSNVQRSGNRNQTPHLACKMTNSSQTWETQRQKDENPKMKSLPTLTIHAIQLRQKTKNHTVELHTAIFHAIPSHSEVTHVNDALTKFALKILYGAVNSCDSIEYEIKGK